MLKLTLFTLSAILLIAQQANACDTANLIPTFKAQETKVLLENAPTFKHAWEDKSILLELQASSSSPCTLAMQLTIPEQDINEAKQHLDANPSKRILLAAQGYALPEVAQNQLSVELDAQGQLTENNLALKQLHSNLEYMYQLLAQLRAEYKPNQINTAAWSTEQKQALMTECAKQYRADNIENACACRASAFEKTISPKQMELIAFIKLQPYSKATGALASFVEYEGQVAHSCGLSKAK
jgi:hypothetical protein